MDNCSNLVAYAEGYSSNKKIEASAAQLGITPMFIKPPADLQKPYLSISDNGLSLVGNGLSLQGDFTGMLKRINGNKLNGELLIRSAKMKNCGSSPTAVDATAGLGESSFLLAAAGFHVTLFEHNPVIAVLLKDALNRASLVPELCDITARMELKVADSTKELLNLGFSPDLIFLDPMFPARQKSGLVKKKLQILQALEQPCTNENELLQSAIAAQPRKIVVKRPAKGPYLSGVKPGYSISSDGIRYDCIVLR